MINGRKVVALIPAAGMGVRMGNGTKKQFLKLGAFEVLNWTLLKFWESEIIDEVVVIVPATDIKTVADKIEIWREKARIAMRTMVVIGGDTRQASVYEGLKCVDRSFEIVVIHDGVRPFVPVELLSIMCDHLHAYDGAVVAIRSTDTLKAVDGNGVIVETVNRERVWSVQTPQVFEVEKLRNAHDVASENHYFATDDASLIENIGGKVLVVEGSNNNIKITTPFDLYVAQALINGMMGV